MSLKSFLKTFIWFICYKIPYVTHDLTTVNYLVKRTGKRSSLSTKLSKLFKVSFFNGPCVKDMEKIKAVHNLNHQ